MKHEILKTSIHIPDLCCATEEGKIRKCLNKQQGIHHIEFNLLAHTVNVRHSCPESHILKRLKEIGMPGVPEAGIDRSSTDSPLQRLILFTSLSGLLFLLAFTSRLLDAPVEVSVVLFLLSMTAGGWQIASKAFLSLKTVSLDMNTLMTMAALGAIGLGQYAEGAAVVLLFSLSLVMESLSIQRTRNAIKSLLALAPTSTTVRRDGAEVVVPVEEIAVGEILVVRPGERISHDGRVMRGHSTVDQSSVTGESLPAMKLPGDPVYAGSFNNNGMLEIEVTQPASDSTIAHIIHAVEDAQSKKAATQSLIERFARIYTPAVFAAAIAVALIPPLLLGYSLTEWLYRSLTLLVIACPCALVISTPIALVSALTRAAHHGVLIKGGKYLEALASVRAIAFDKTGTLTRGKPVVTDILSLNAYSRIELLRIAATLELNSEHHLADAILQEAARENIVLRDGSNEHFRSTPGRGIQGRIDGTLFSLGNHDFAEDLGVCSPAVEQQLQMMEREGKSVILLSDQERVLGIFAIADQLRAESPVLVQSLRSAGIEHIELLTGDSQHTASHIADQLKIQSTRSSMLPTDKLQAIQALKRQYKSVAMVGDGINDAPALAAADVGFAMGGIGSDTALESADVVLFSDDILKIPYSIALGRKTLRIIRQNLVIALLTKGIFLFFGVMGWATLWLAILADDGITLLVILNSMRLLKDGALLKNIHEITQRDTNDTGGAES